MNLLQKQREWQERVTREERDWRKQQAERERTWRLEDKADERKAANQLFWQSMFCAILAAIATVAVAEYFDFFGSP